MLLFDVDVDVTLQGSVSTICGTDTAIHLCGEMSQQSILSAAQSSQFHAFYTELLLMKQVSDAAILSD